MSNMPPHGAGSTQWHSFYRNSPASAIYITATQSPPEIPPEAVAGEWRTPPKKKMAAVLAAALRRSAARSFSAVAAEAVVSEARLFRGVEVFGAKEYEEYRRSRYGEITHKALLVDAAGTLLVPSQPMAEVRIFCIFCCVCSWRCALLLLLLIRFWWVVDI